MACCLDCSTDEGPEAQKRRSSWISLPPLDGDDDLLSEASSMCFGESHSHLAALREERSLRLPGRRGAQRPSEASQSPDAASCPH